MIEGQRPVERRRLMRGLALKDARALLCRVGGPAAGQLRRREIAHDIQIVRLEFQRFRQTFMSGGCRAASP